MVARHLGQFALSFGKTIAQILAEFSPIPGLCPIADALVGIIELCENVTHNRNEARHLRDRCHLLVFALRDGLQEHSSHMGKATTAVHDCLLDIQTRMDGWVHIGRLQGFTRQVEIKAEIVRCLSAIDDCMTKFQLSSQIQMHKWQEEFATAARLDHEEMIAALSEVKSTQAMSHDLLHSKVEENSEILRGMMGMMQDLMAENKRTAEQRHKGISTNLWQFQRQSGELLPNLHLKSGEVVRVKDQPMKTTNVMDIYEGLYLGNERVYIKSLRGIEAGEHSLRRFKREVKIWTEIWKLDRGTYILPFYGFALHDGPFPYMVSPWQKSGNVLDFVKANDETVDYHRLIRRIALGIRFLHCTMQPPIVHGIIRADNIYINEQGNPLLADFGVSQIIEDVTGIPLTQSHSAIQSHRWFAPEVCIGEGAISFSSDIYAYGMTVLEVISHQPPYSHIKHATEVVIRSSKGEFPKRPFDTRVVERGLDDKLWSLLLRCWSQTPRTRPTIEGVLTGLE